MRYLIINDLEDAKDIFYTNWFDYENNYIEGMIVFDLQNNTHTTDGKNWIDTETDHL